MGKIVNALTGPNTAATMLFFPYCVQTLLVLLWAFFHLSDSQSDALLGPSDLSAMNFPLPATASATENTSGDDQSVSISIINVPPLQFLDQSKSNIGLFSSPQISIGISG